MHTAASPNRRFVTLIAMVASAIALLLSATSAQATSYDNGLIETDSNCSWMGQGSVQGTTMHIQLNQAVFDFGEPLVKSLTGGNQLVALRTDLMRSNGTTAAYGAWFFAYAMGNGRFLRQTDSSGFVYDNWNAATGARFAVYKRSFDVTNSGGPSDAYHLMLTVAWYSGSPARVVRQTTVPVTVGGQNRTCTV
jgi:hypothetical protein